MTTAIAPFSLVRREGGDIDRILHEPHIKRLLAGSDAPLVEVEPLRFFRVRYDSTVKKSLVSRRAQ
jgi:hypothetical protein